jgi:hypothetical protein
MVGLTANFHFARAGAQVPCEPQRWDPGPSVLVMAWGAKPSGHGRGWLGKPLWFIAPKIIHGGSVDCRRVSSLSFFDMVESIRSCLIFFGQCTSNLSGHFLGFLGKMMKSRFQNLRSNWFKWPWLAKHRPEFTAALRRWVSTPRWDFLGDTALRGHPPFWEQTYGFLRRFSKSPMISWYIQLQPMISALYPRYLPILIVGQQTRCNTPRCGRSPRNVHWALPWLTRHFSLPHIWRQRTILRPLPRTGYGLVPGMASR